MINPEFEIFKDNMFVQARTLIADLAPAPDMELFDLTVG